MRKSIVTIVPIVLLYATILVATFLVFGLLAAVVIFGHPPHYLFDRLPSYFLFFHLSFR